jgi:hypothetical protein
MRRVLLTAFGVIFFVCIAAGCASAPGSADSQITKETEPENVNVPKGISPTEDEIAQTITQFEGISREDAIALWHVKRKQEQASAGYEAYWTLLRRSGEDDQALLVDTIKTLREAKDLLDPVCRAYPNNQPLNSLSEAMMGDLNSLEARKK